MASVLSLTCLARATLRARIRTSWNLWSSNCWISRISSIDVGKVGISSTEIMCSAARWRFASSQASSSALNPPSDPSLATTMVPNISHLPFRRALSRQIPFLSDQGGDHGAADHRGHQDRILLLVDDTVCQSEQGRDRAEGEAGRHQERGVHAFPVLEAEQPGQREDADERGRQLEDQE